MRSQASSTKIRLTSLKAKYGDVLETFTGEVRICCPYCIHKVGRADTKHHLYANLSKGVFICHRCGARGQSGQLVDETATFENLTEQWYDTVQETLAGLIEEDIQKVKLPEDVEEIEEGDHAYRYLKARGFDWPEITKYRIMVWPNRDRLIIPSFRSNKLDFWIARTYVRDEPKYLNPVGGSRRHSLFGYDQVKGQPSIIICEGSFSAMAAWAATGVEAVATYGKLVAAEQVKLLLGLKPKEFIVAFDEDADLESHILASILQSKSKARVKIIDWSKLKTKRRHPDPASIKRESFRKLFEFAPKYDWHRQITSLLSKT